MTGGASRRPEDERTHFGIRAGENFYRAHGLGNDYLVFTTPPGGGPSWAVTAESVRRVCDRHRGVGSDGMVLLLDPNPAEGVFPLRMFNPDGSEFERSGNGLRVLASYLHRRGLVETGPFVVASGGSRIPMTVHGFGSDGSYDVSVEMGRAQVGEAAVGLDQSHAESHGDGPSGLLHPDLGTIPFVPVSVGNPHAVVFADELEGDSGRRPGANAIDLVGPFLSRHEAFPEGTNVQLVRSYVSDRIEIEIWERGVGRTSASGTSSCAAAVAAVQTGRSRTGRITVEMEGGVLQVSVGPELEVVLRGPVEEISDGRLTGRFRESL